MIDRPFPSLKIQADRNFAISLFSSQDLVAQLAHERQYQARLHNEQDPIWLKYIAGNIVDKNEKNIIMSSWKWRPKYYHISTSVNLVLQKFTRPKVGFLLFFDLLFLWHNIWYPPLQMSTFLFPFFHSLLDQFILIFQKSPLGSNIFPYLSVFLGKLCPK